MHDLTDRSSPIIFILYAVVVRSECHGNLGFLDFFVLLFVKGGITVKPRTGCTSLFWIFSSLHRDKSIHTSPLVFG